jgi:hypothetical protein
VAEISIASPGSGHAARVPSLTDAAGATRKSGDEGDAALKNVTEAKNPPKQRPAHAKVGSQDLRCRPSKLSGQSCREPGGPPTTLRGNRSLDCPR